MPSSVNNRFSNVYEPVFLFVKEESKYNYYLSIDELRLSVKNFSNIKEPEEIIGLKVKNNLFKDKKGKTEGQVEKVFRTKDGNTLAEVNWKNGEKVLTLVNDFDKESQIEVSLVCEKYGKKVIHEIDLDNHTNCDGFLRPMLPLKSNFEFKD